MTVAVSVMAVAAVTWLTYEFWRLLWQPQPEGAIDLLQRHTELHEWFGGVRVYGVRGTAVYPPASYAMLWPFLSWVGFTAARWVWAATTIACLAVLVRLIVRESGATGRLEQAFVACMCLSMYATGASVGNGQVTIHVLTALLGGLLLLSRKPDLRRDLAAAGLILFALVKVTISAPFFWMVLFVPGRMRPALLVVVGYVALTLVGAAPQESSAPRLMRQWQEAGMRGVEYGSPKDASSNVHTLIVDDWEEQQMQTVDQQAFTRDVMLAATLGTLALLLLWIVLCRKADRWVLLGVTAVVARLWAYHNWYDDLLILLPMVALFRTAKSGVRPNARVLAGLLLCLAVPVMLAPGGLYALPHSWRGPYENGQTLLWLAMGAFLLVPKWVRVVEHSGAE